MQRLEDTSSSFNVSLRKLVNVFDKNNVLIGNSGDCRLFFMLINSFISKQNVDRILTLAFIGQFNSNRIFNSNSSVFKTDRISG